MGVSSKKNRKSSEINITPLVDVMLVLLVIFMVVSPAVSSDIKVKVPKINSKHSAVSEDNKSIVIVLKKNKEIYINGEKVQDFEKMKEADLLSEIQFKADESLSYQEVFSVLEELKNLGFQNINLVGEE